MVAAVAVLTTLGVAFDEYLNSRYSEQKATSRKSGYGSPEDFQRAIEDLKVALAHIEDAVSTNPDVLHEHGFPITGIFHPGAER